MPTMTGRSAVKSYLGRIPEQMKGVLRGAARKGGEVFADEVKANTTSDDVRDAVRIRTKVDDSHVTVAVDLKPGWGRVVGNWLEYGTSPHFISVDDSQRGGRSVARINQLVGEEGGNRSLVIGGNFVGRTILHPGARPYPTFRPARDTKEAEAIAAAQAYIDSRVSRAGIKGSNSGGGDE